MYFVVLGGLVSPHACESGAEMNAEVSLSQK